MAFFRSGGSICPAFSLADAGKATETEHNSTQGHSRPTSLPLPTSFTALCDDGHVVHIGTAAVTSQLVALQLVLAFGDRGGTLRHVSQSFRGSRRRRV